MIENTVSPEQNSMIGVLFTFERLSGFSLAAFLSHQQGTNFNICLDLILEICCFPKFVLLQRFVLILFMIPNE